MEITEDAVKNIVNEEFKHHWEIGLPQHCEKNHELSETKITQCVSKKLNTFLWKLVAALIVINFGAAFTMIKIMEKFIK